MEHHVESLGDFHQCGYQKWLVYEGKSWKSICKWMKFIVVSLFQDSPSLPSVIRGLLGTLVVSILGLACWLPLRCWAPSGWIPWTSLDVSAIGFRSLLADLPVQRLQATIVSYGAGLNACERAEQWTQALRLRIRDMCVCI